MRLHLIRHGESTWNVEGRLQGQTSHPRLTARGRRQARSAAGALESTAIDAIWSSDLARAVETAEIISEIVDSDVSTTPLLREQALGDMEGKLTTELEPLPTPDGTHISEIRWGGGESIEDVHRRLSRFMDQLRAEPSGEVALVSHGDTIRVLLALLAGRSHRDVEWIPVENGVVIPVEI